MKFIKRLIVSVQDHTIIDIKDISKHQADSGPKRDLKTIQCEAHTGKASCMYCITCQELVCLTCIAKTHKTHDFCEISHAFKTKLKKVEIRRSIIEKGIQNLATNVNKLEQIKTTELSKYHKVKQEILDFDKTLMNEIQKQKDELIKDLDQKWEVFSKKVEHEEKCVEEKQKQIQEEKQTINNLLQKHKEEDVCFLTNSLVKSPETNVYPINTSFQGIPNFIPGDRSKIPLVYARLEDYIIQCKTKLQIEKRFVSELDVISSVVMCFEDSLWISDSIADTLQKVKVKGDNLSVISNIKIQVYDAAIFLSGDLLFSVIGSSSLKLIPSGSNDVTDSVYRLSPLINKGVHVTCDNKVLVGVVDSTAISATGTRQVIVMDQTGHHEKVFQYDTHNKQLFTVPFRLVSNSRGNIAVVDIVSEDRRGRVIVFDQEGGIINIYPGVSDVNKALTPMGITTTPSDNFVIAYSHNYILHILNSEGEIITLYNTKEMGINLPHSLSFSTTGQLYIGCNNYKASKETALIFTINDFLY